MPKSQNKETTAENLEQRFDQGEDVLDYFDVDKARVIKPQSERSTAKSKFKYPARPSNRRAAVVREKPARYRKKTG